jgi:hypothetical protein
MQFADSAGNIAVGALIQKNTLSFCILRIFLSVFREIMKGKGLIHVTGKGKRLCYITVFERVTFTLFSALKGIKFLLAVCRRG